MYTYPIDAIMKWNGREVSDHNRGPLSVTYEKFVIDHRLIDGTLRRLSLGRDRRTFKVDWKALFNDDRTVDGFMGYDSIREFYESTPGDFEMIISHGNGDTEKVRVMFQDLSMTVTKRSKETDFYDVSVVMLEV